MVRYFWRLFNGGTGRGDDNDQTWKELNLARKEDPIMKAEKSAVGDAFCTSGSSPPITNKEQTMAHKAEVEGVSLSAHEGRLGAAGVQAGTSEATITLVPPFLKPTAGTRLALSRLIEREPEILQSMGMSPSSLCPRWRAVAEENIICAAYHEAAHFVLGITECGEVAAGISIELSEPAHGAIFPRGRRRPRAWAEGRAMVQACADDAKMMKEMRAYSEARVRMTLAGHAEEMALGLRGNDWWDLVQEDIWDSRPARTPTSAILRRVTSSRPWTNFAFTMTARGPTATRYLQRWFERLAHQTDDLVRRNDIAHAIADVAEILLDHGAIFDRGEVAITMSTLVNAVERNLAAAKGPVQPRSGPEPEYGAPVQSAPGRSASHPKPERRSTRAQK